ncbi:hypothetical protein [Sphingobacterium hungaricum]|nr:hypothetical protein [Sphingobacterium hungaricum]
MKKSNIYFSIAILIMLAFAFFPPLLGNIRIKERDVPADFLSAYWIKTFDYKTSSKLPDNIQFIRVEGNENYVQLNVNRSDSTVLNSPRPDQYEFEVKNDTLILKTFKKDMTFYIQSKQEIKSVDIRNTYAYLNVPNQDSLIILGEDKSKIDMSHNDNDTSKFSKIFVKLKSESRLYFRNVKSEKIDIVLENSVFNYDSKLNVDSVSVNLVGKSTVKSQNSDEVQHVKNLRISGDKTYFKNEFAGNGVNVN